jgi:osmoprotectant transport system ATP-binding protein
VVFVTHDIDEAVKMGTRIARLNVGAHLEQYDTPAVLLGRPATPFVADFVGSDRALKRLQVTCISRDDIEPTPVVGPAASAADVAAALDAARASAAIVVDPAAPTKSATIERFTGTDTAGSHALPVESVTADASLDDALALVLLTDGGRVAVTDAGAPIGILTITGIHRSLRRSLGEEGAATTAEGARA